MTHPEATIEAPVATSTQDFKQTDLVPLGSQANYHTVRVLPFLCYQPSLVEIKIFEVTALQSGPAAEDLPSQRETHTVLMQVQSHVI